MSVLYQKAECPGQQANTPSWLKATHHLASKVKPPSSLALATTPQIASSEKLLLCGQRAKPPSSAHKLFGSKELRSGPQRSPKWLPDPVALFDLCDSRTISSVCLHIIKK